MGTSHAADLNFGLKPDKGSPPSHPKSPARGRAGVPRKKRFMASPKKQFVKPQWSPEKTQKKSGKKPGQKPEKIFSHKTRLIIFLCFFSEFFLVPIFGLDRFFLDLPGTASQMPTGTSCGCPPSSHKSKPCIVDPWPSAILFGSLGSRKTSLSQGARQAPAADPDHCILSVPAIQHRQYDYLGEVLETKKICKKEAPKNTFFHLPICPRRRKHRVWPAREWAGGPMATHKGQ